MVSPFASVMPILELYGENNVVLFDDEFLNDEDCPECGEILDEDGICPNDCDLMEHPDDMYVDDLDEDDDFESEEDYYEDIDEGLFVEMDHDD